MASAQHYLALRPYVELLTIGGESGNQALLIPRGQAPELALLRLGERLELQQSQSRTTSLFLLLSSGGLIVYLLYKSFSDDDQDTAARPQTHQQRWSAQNWLRWLLFGDTNDLRGQYFGPIQPHPPSQLAGGEASASSSSTSVERLRKPNIVYVSPCPNCVRGVCKIRKHHQMLYHRHQYVPIMESASTSGASTPCRLLPVEQSKNKKASSGGASKTADCSADDESSDDDLDLRVKVKESPSRNKKVRQNRIPPEGRDSSNKNKTSYTMARDDESMDSIAGYDGEVSGSMVDLVKGAREVRRLIREASFDSLASEFSLDLQDNLGGATASQFDSICNEISRLKDNCDIMSESIEFKGFPSKETAIQKSKSDYNFKETTPPNSLNPITNTSTASLSSSPDLRNLHKIIHSAPRNKALWTLTTNTGFSDNDSNYSPIHHDSRDAKYKLVSLSSNASECGEWEWDSEGLSGADFSSFDNAQQNYHETWLQDDPMMELDLEAELLSSTFNMRKRSDSTSSELESSLYGKIRLPPSGRSSVMSHQDKMSLSFSRSSSINSLKNLDSPSCYNPTKKPVRKSYVISSSDESGIEDKSTDYSIKSSASVTTPLSPVHEAKESPHKTPKIPREKSRRKLGDLSAMQ